ncbi:helix-turn-helix domain-containing protein [Phenylobacterium sp.]|uniref:helix-turn-helix domain-containing protein n=1 Tax=Phenylobacterium sp. TaxID=1871053 RepID=UPI00356960AC
MEIDVHIALVIRARRKARGVTQAALAEAVGVSVDQIQACENGMRRTGVGLLVRIAVGLDCGVSDLVVRPSA